MGRALPLLALLATAPAAAQEAAPDSFRVSTGSFGFEIAMPGTVELVALREGFAAHRQLLHLPLNESVSCQKSRWRTI